jgi:hypothetical protein
MVSSSDLMGALQALQSTGAPEDIGAQGQVIPLDVSQIVERLHAQLKRKRMTVQLKKRYANDRFGRDAIRIYAE